MTDVRPGEQTTSASRGPLTGTLVIDLTRALAGPHAGMMLGDLGARVIKVEAPGRGDDTRGWGPPFIGDDAVSSYFLSCNRDKESIALNLKDPDDLSVLEQLIERADVLLENFRPGVMDRLGLSQQRLHELNRRLVVLSVTGFGHDGPEAARSGYDQILQGESGLMSVTGAGPADPQKVGVPIADLLAGMYGAYGVLAALLERERTGVGTVVRTSLLASVVGVHAFQGTRVTVAGEQPRAQGNHHPSISPYGLFACQDGHVQISVGSERLWSIFCEEFGTDPADPRFATNADRVANHAAMVELVEGVFAGLQRAELLARLTTAGIPAGVVRPIEEVYSWPQALSQGLAIDVEHSSIGPITLPGPPLRFFDHDGTEVTRTEHAPPPMLDEHGEAIRSWIRDGGTDR